MNKEAEIAEFRRKHLYYTAESIRKIKRDELLQENARYRERLYDAILNGETGESLCYLTERKKY